MVYIQTINFKNSRESFSPCTAVQMNMQNILNISTEKSVTCVSSVIKTYVEGIMSNMDSWSCTSVCPCAISKQMKPLV